VGPQDAFCASCAASLAPIEQPCPGCAAPAQSCACRGRFPFASARAALLYGGAVVPAIVRLKHKERADIARALGRFLAPLLTADADAVLPVPLHPRRLRARGYNQAQALARAAARKTGPPVWVGGLERVRDTPILGTAAPERRRALVDGAFAVPHPARVRGRRLILVDDVMTTGATLAACAHTLLAAGAREVRVAVLSRAP
jgi:ComF family protein